MLTKDAQVDTKFVQQSPEHSSCTKTVWGVPRRKGRGEATEEAEGVGARGPELTETVGVTVRNGLLVKLVEGVTEAVEVLVAEELGVIEGKKEEEADWTGKPVGTAADADADAPMSGDDVEA